MSSGLTYYWSLDLSTTNVGMALWNEKGQLVELRHLQLKVDRIVPEEDRYIPKAITFKDYALKYKQHVKETYNANIDQVFIEQPLSSTPKNINTTAMLLRFNGIACYIVYEVFGIPPLLITVHQSRKIFCVEFVTKKGTLSFPKGWKSKEKKFFIWQKVSKLEPNIQWFYKAPVKSKTNKTTKTGIMLKDESFDMSDAFCVGFAGLKLINIEWEGYLKTQ